MSSINPLSAVSAYSSTTTSPTSQQTQLPSDIGKDAFLKLLIAQLQNQDPLKPMDDTQFISQMAQFNTLEQLQEMNDNFQSLMNFQQLALGSSLIGKTVDAIDPTSHQSFEGQISEVRVVGGVPKLVIGTKQIDLKDITLVH